MPTLFVTKDQYDAFSAEHKKNLYAICYLMVADELQTDWTYPLWNADGNDGLLWVSHNQVLSKWDGDGLNHRFRVAGLDEVNSYNPSIPATPPVIPPVTPPVTPPITPPVTPPINLSGSYHITGTIGVIPVDLRIELED